MTQADRLFRAVADSTRLRLLALLREGESCVCDLVAAIGAPQPKISRHLAYLRRAGLVKARKKGLWVHYKLAPAQGILHRKLLECLTCCGGSAPPAERDRQRLYRAREQRECCAPPKRPLPSKSACCDERKMR